MPWPVACKPSPGLIKKVTGVGVDETAFLRVTGQHPTRFAAWHPRPDPGRAGEAARRRSRTARQPPTLKDL